MILSQHRHIFHASLKKEVLVIADYTTHYGVSDKELVIIKTFRLQLELSIPVIYLFWKPIISSVFRIAGFISEFVFAAAI